jgi:hypothetical protein
MKSISFIANKSSSSSVISLSAYQLRLCRIRQICSQPIRREEHLEHPLLPGRVRHSPTLHRNEIPQASLHQRTIYRPSYSCRPSMSRNCSGGPTAMRSARSVIASGSVPASRRNPRICADSSRDRSPCRLRFCVARVMPQVSALVGVPPLMVLG